MTIWAPETLDGGPFVVGRNMGVPEGRLEVGVPHPLPPRAHASRPEWVYLQTSDALLSPLAQGGTVPPKPNYQSAKRQRDLAKKKKQEGKRDEKRQRQAEAREGEASRTAPTPPDEGASN